MKQIALMLMLALITAAAFADGTTSTPEAAVPAAATTPAVTAPAAAPAAPATSLMDEANQLMDAAKYDEALAKLAEIEKADPTNPDVFRYQGFCYKSEKKFDEAIKAYDKCLELKPTLEVEAKAYFNKGDIYLQQKKYEDAIKMFDKIIEIKAEKQLPDAHRGRAQVLLAQGKTPEGNEEYLKAIDCYKKGMETSPADENITYNCACCYSIMGDKTNALSFLEKAIKLNDEAIKAKTSSSSLKVFAPTDPDFEKLWKDPDFLKLCTPPAAGTGEVKGN
ncbi:MAG: tetratricopeptide repeat protein [Candidatus Wallbacteria bacterium]|nr:tetratricopeptide repeat protein [Candidatus Wallbacteria bacterium]